MVAVSLAVCLLGIVREITVAYEMSGKALAAGFSALRRPMRNRWLAFRFSRIFSFWVSVVLCPDRDFLGKHG